MIARHTSALLLVSTIYLGAATATGCGTEFTSAEGGVDEGSETSFSSDRSSSDGLSTSDAPSDVSSRSDGIASDVLGGSEGSTGEGGTPTFQCADLTTYCVEGTEFCLYETASGVTTCQLLKTCDNAADPCNCAAGTWSLYLLEICTTSADSVAPDKCQVTCHRVKDAGSDAGVPHDATVNPPDSGPRDVGVRPPTDGTIPPSDAGKPKDSGVAKDTGIIMPSCDGSGVAGDIICPL